MEVCISGYDLKKHKKAMLTVIRDKSFVEE